MHSKVPIILLMIYLESLMRQNDSITALETSLNEKNGKISVNYSFMYTFR